MPIFNDITFIHIPKCGGSSITKFLMDKNYKTKMFLLNTDVTINGHTPQHCTYLELKKLGLCTDKIFTVIRPHVDRTISEYFYLKKYTSDLGKLFNTFDEFLDIFLDKKNIGLFDNHNLPNIEFLKNDNGELSEEIKIFNFFEVEKIENFLNENGLKNYHIMKPNSERYNFDITNEQKYRIIDFFGDN